MLRLISAVGERSARSIEQLGDISIFGCQIVKCFLRPPLRFRPFVKELHKLGVLSLLIIGISGLAVGMVLALQGYIELSKYGSESSLGGFVGIVLVRELGPVLTGLLVTGRAGSATTAEIGTMVASEQLDGLRMMSVNPIDVVVVPRALAMILVMPLLNAIFTVLGLLGGWLVGVRVMGLDSGAYIGSLTASVGFQEDVASGLLKSVLFGVLVALVSTYKGFNSAPTSEGVSHSTTMCVVTASLAILVSNYFFTALWGM